MTEMDRHRLKTDGVDGSHKNRSQKTERLGKKPTQTLRAEKEGSTKNRQARKQKLTSRYWHRQIETDKNQLAETKTKQKVKKKQPGRNKTERADKYRPAERTKAGH